MAQQDLALLHLIELLSSAPTGPSKDTILSARKALSPLPTIPNSSFRAQLLCRVLREASASSPGELCCVLFLWCTHHSGDYLLNAYLVHCAEFQEGTDHICLVHKCLAHLQSSCWVRQSLHSWVAGVSEESPRGRGHVCPSKGMVQGTQEEKRKKIIDTCLKERTLPLFVLMA